MSFHVPVAFFLEHIELRQYQLITTTAQTYACQDGDMEPVNEVLVFLELPTWLKKKRKKYKYPKACRYEIVLVLLASFFPKYKDYTCKGICQIWATRMGWHRCRLIGDEKCTSSRGCSALNKYPMTRFKLKHRQQTLGSKHNYLANHIHTYEQNVSKTTYLSERSQTGGSCQCTRCFNTSPFFSS